MSNWPPGTSILPSCHRQATAQKSRSPRFPPPHNRHRTIVRNQREKKWERDGLPCPNRSLFPTLVQKVSKKENTTKIFLKLSFFGNISVCVVAVKAVYWGTGPVSGVSCCGDSLESTSSSRRRQLPPQISCRTHWAAQHRNLHPAAQISRQTREGKMPSFFYKYITAGMFSQQATLFCFWTPIQN